ncbi:MAG: sigma-70 family RNA polymerase sigma factor, partial [Clostridia bacterium]|nr:sigma-70 family RNA polymerase sigma factor [Clostridia bacterium]
MHDTAIADRLIETFSKDYFEKLFYFCLKRTGNPTEAEELTSEVSLAILTALRAGTVPLHFSAWVWQIARNCYSHWADRKHRRSETVSGTDLEDFADIASEESVEESVIHSEELKLLRRELAFISADYRDVVVAFYIEDRKVSDIARSLQISEGTVKSKLFRSRNLLKEGMNMAREFGSKSYKPENVDFAASGSQPSGLPWSAVQRQIPKNILLEASNNPSTIEELSIELGIAMPYMEEEVGILERATLLKKIGNKYITNFFIQDRETQHAVYKILRNDSVERSAMLDQIVTDSIPAIRELGVVRNGMSDNDLKWLLIPALIDQFNDKFDFSNPVVRANGETWGFVGYEQTELPEST